MLAVFKPKCVALNNLFIRFTGFKNLIMHRRILAFSSSTEGNGGYLQTAAPAIQKFLGNKPLHIAFIPFAAVSLSYEAYTDKVSNALKGLPYAIQVTEAATAKIKIENADVIMVGGGNTFKLLHDLYALELTALIKQKVNGGTPYIGWSAGSNIVGATICTSNDMPIINPGTFSALGFFPFQINPHYYNQTVAGFNEETRNQRLAEFLQLNPTIPVVALPEGTGLIQEENKLMLQGNKEAFLFRWENEMVQSVLPSGENLSYLLK